MVPILVAYKNLILQISLVLALSLILSFLRIPVLFLLGLHTYIHPENLGQKENGVKAAIRRPSSSVSASGIEGYQTLSSKTNVEVKKRNKSKEKFEFDENNAQIFRLKLDESHIQSRLYFKEYYNAFNFSFIAISCLLLQFYFDDSEETGNLVNGKVIPVFLGFLGVCKVFGSLAKVSLEKSASSRSEKQLSSVFSVLGFVLGLVIAFEVFPSAFDFDLGFGSVDWFGRVSVAVLMGCITGLLYMPAAKNARSFWLGTDQLRCNLSIVSCGWIARMILYANYLLIVFTALLWINPFAKILVNDSIDGSRRGLSISGIKDAENLVGNVGMSRSCFVKLRLWCLLLSGLLQVLALRPNLQMYLNEAVLCWYQRLHASKVPDLDFSRAKVFLHNHYLCLAVLQFLMPAILVLLFLGLSQIVGSTFASFQICNLLPCSAFVKEVALFMAWWVILVWAVFTSASLALYRHGILYVS